MQSGFRLNLHMDIYCDSTIDIDTVEGKFNKDGLGGGFTLTQAYMYDTLVCPEGPSSARMILWSCISAGYIRENGGKVSDYGGIRAHSVAIWHH